MNQQKVRTNPKPRLAIRVDGVLDRFADWRIWIDFDWFPVRGHGWLRFLDRQCFSSNYSGRG